MPLDWNPLTRFLLPLLVALVAIAVLVWAVQRRLIYLPAGAPPAVSDVLPDASEVEVHTEDGLGLSAWFLAAGPTAVLFLPGNAGNRATRAPLASALADRGLSVLLLDYRGYGGNPGTPTEAGLRADARAAEEWLRGRAEVERIVYLGESLGAAVAVGLAVERAPDALVLRSPFAALLDVAREHYGPVPAVFLRDTYPTVRRIGDVDAPVLVVAGEADTIVPLEQSREVFEAATEPRRFVTIPAAGHNDPALLDGDRFLDAVVAFLAEHGVTGG